GCRQGPPDWAGRRENAAEGRRRSPDWSRLAAAERRRAMPAVRREEPRLAVARHRPGAAACWDDGAAPRPAQNERRRGPARSAGPGSIGASFGAGRLASTLARAARARASADFWPRGSFSATLASVFVCLLGGNAFASFPALRAGCATGASVSGAGLCLLTAAA